MLNNSSEKNTNNQEKRNILLIQETEKNKR